jgi:hypothetical protein
MVTMRSVLGKSSVETAEDRILFRRRFNYFPALVLAALGADPVRLFGLVAVGAFRRGRLGQGIVSAAGLRALVGVSAFRIRHCFSLLTSLNSICAAELLNY